MSGRQSRPALTLNTDSIVVATGRYTDVVVPGVQVRAWSRRRIVQHQRRDALHQLLTTTPLRRLPLRVQPAGPDRSTLVRDCHLETAPAPTRDRLADALEWLAAKAAR